MVRSNLSVELLQTPARPILITDTDHPRRPYVATEPLWTTVGIRTTPADQPWWEKALVVAAFTVLILILAPAAFADTAAGNLPPPPTRAATIVDRVLSNPEIQLAMIVLGFGVLMMLCEVVVIVRLTFSEDATIRILTLTLVIVATLFIIAAGFSKEDIAPAMGLFGTVIGYLLGRQTFVRSGGDGDRGDRK